MSVITSYSIHYTKLYEAVIAVLPCMREPTIATLHGDSGYAVKAAVPRADLPRVSYNFV